jgi:hypothetical protein
MLTWYAAGAVFGVWNVFQSNGLDVRAIALGALLPLLIDLPFGQQKYGHTLLGAVLALVIVMLATARPGQRLARRHLIGVPIGWFCGLVLSFAFANEHTFWWPFLGRTFDEASLWPALPLAIGLEVVGLIATRWCWVRFGLADPARRRVMLRQGKVSVV